MTKPEFLTGDAPGIASFIKKFDVFLFDCDGVLWSGDHLFDGVRETLELLRRKGKRLVFVTNNSTKSRASYKAKFDSMNIPVEVDEIFGSSYSAAIYISRILRPEAPHNKIFVLGEAGIEDELSSESLSFTGGTSSTLNRPIQPEDFKSIASGIALDPDVSIVLAGLDFGLNYLKLAHALAYLQRGAAFLATNGDSTLPSAGALFPGAGAVGAPLVKAAGREPVYLGKPSQAMMDAVEGKFGFERSRACMVGDRLDTDIRFGKEGGLGGTMLVLTGVSRKEEFLGEHGEGKDGAVVPSAYVERLGDLRVGLEVEV